MKGGENSIPNTKWLETYATQIHLISNAYRRLEELSQKGQHDLAKGSSSVLLLPFNLTANGLAEGGVQQQQNQNLQSFVLQFEEYMLKTTDFNDKNPRLGIVLWVLLAPQFHNLKLALEKLNPKTQDFTYFTNYTERAKQLGNGNASPIPASYLKGLTKDNLTKRKEELDTKIETLQGKIQNNLAFQWIDWFQLYLCVAEQIILTTLLTRQEGQEGQEGGKNRIPSRRRTNQNVQWARTHQGRLRMIRKRKQRGGEETQLTTSTIKKAMGTKIQDWRGKQKDVWEPYSEKPINEVVKEVIPILYLNVEQSAMNTIKQLDPQLKQLFANIQRILPANRQTTTKEESNSPNLEIERPLGVALPINRQESQTIQTTDLKEQLQSVINQLSPLINSLKEKNLQTALQSFISQAQSINIETSPELKRLYNNLRLKLHPNKTGSNGTKEEIFKLLQQLKELIKQLKDSQSGLKEIESNQRKALTNSNTSQGVSLVTVADNKQLTINSSQSSSPPPLNILGKEREKNQISYKGKKGTVLEYNKGIPKRIQYNNQQFNTNNKIKATHKFMNYINKTEPKK